MSTIQTPRKDAANIKSGKKPDFSAIDPARDTKPPLPADADLQPPPRTEPQPPAPGPTIPEETEPQTEPAAGPEPKEHKHGIRCPLCKTWSVSIVRTRTRNYPPFMTVKTSKRRQKCRCEAAGCGHEWWRRVELTEKELPPEK